MVRIKLISVVFIFLASLIITNQPVFAEGIKFGVQAPRGHAKALRKWTEFGNYLSKEIKTIVEIVPLTPTETSEAVKSGKIQFMLSNPVLAVTLKKKNNSIVIATMNKKSGHQFAGVIISKKGSGIKHTTDLKGKRAMAFKFKKSAAAYVFQTKHLKDKGFNVHKDFSVFREAKKQDDIVMAVKVEAVDVGFIKTGLLESMIKEGKVKLSDFNIIDKVNDNFALVHSTALYPSWTVTASSVNKLTVNKVKTALFKMTKKMPASKKAKIIGFVKPQSLKPLAMTLKELNLPPFK